MPDHLQNDSLYVVIPPTFSQSEQLIILKSYIIENNSFRYLIKTVLGLYYCICNFFHEGEEVLSCVNDDFLPSVGDMNCL